MRIFVAGASGAMGRQLIPQLIERGHEVTGTTRSGAKAAGVRALGAEPVVVDALDRTQVLAAVAASRPDVIVHQLTALGGAPDLRKFDRYFADTNRLRTVGTDHLLAAADAVGVRRFVAQSFTGWPYARVGGPVKVETDPFDEHPAANARESLAAIRYLEHAVTAAPLESLVLRYGGFYGPGNAIGRGGELLTMVRARKLPIVGGGHGIWSFVHIDDAASATVAAIEDGPQGIYNVTDDEPAEVRVWLPYLAELIGAQPPRSVPAWLVRPLLGGQAITMMTVARGASNAKARAELAWKPQFATWRDGFRHGLG